MRNAMAMGVVVACAGAMADDAVFVAAHVPGEVIVKFEQAPTAQMLAGVAGSTPITSWRSIPHAPQAKNGGAHPLSFVRVGNLAEGINAIAASEQLLNVQGVVYAHPNYKTQIALEPNDPFYNTDQYGPQIIDAPGAWDVTTGNPDLVLAVADTGLNYNHEDFQEGAVFQHPGEIPGNGIDDDNNGYIDDVNGWDCLNDNANATDGNGHGSHVAGTSAARLDNGIGIAGMANVKILPLQVFNAGGGGTWEAIAEAVYYATDNGAQVINYSGGGGGGNGMLADAAEYAWENNVSFIAAAGNFNSPNPFYPAFYPTVIAISGTDSNDNRYTSSNYGDWIDVAAPGVDVFSCRDGGAQAYGYSTGTSMSSPHAAGLACLLYSIEPTLTPQDIRDLLRDNAVDLGDPGFDIFFGYGRIDAAATVAALGGGCYPDFDGDGMLTILDFVAYQAAFSAGDASADCDGSGGLDILDFVCFQAAFQAGCE